MGYNNRKGEKKGAGSPTSNQLCGYFTTPPTRHILFSLIYLNFFIFVFFPSFFLLSWGMELQNSSAGNFRFAQFVDHVRSFFRWENAVWWRFNLKARN